MGAAVVVTRARDVVVGATVVVVEGRAVVEGAAVVVGAAVDVGAAVVVGAAVEEETGVPAWHLSWSSRRMNHRMRRHLELVVTTNNNPSFMAVERSSPGSSPDDPRCSPTCTSYPTRTGTDRGRPDVRKGDLRSLQPEGQMKTLANILWVVLRNLVCDLVASGGSVSGDHCRWSAICAAMPEAHQFTLWPFDEPRSSH